MPRQLRQPAGGRGKPSIHSLLDARLRQRQDRPAAASADGIDTCPLTTRRTVYDAAGGCPQQQHPARFSRQKSGPATAGYIFVRHFPRYVQWRCTYLQGTGLYPLGARVGIGAEAPGLNGVSKCYVQVLVQVLVQPGY